MSSVAFICAWLSRHWDPSSVPRNSTFPSCKPRRARNRLNHCHDALNSDSGMFQSKAMDFALAMAMDGFTVSFARNRRSIQTYNMSSSSVNFPTAARSVCRLVSSEKQCRSF
jgi:hypothetical protein